MLPKKPIAQEPSLCNDAPIEAEVEIVGLDGKI